jgi:hypothetical protein
MENSGAFPVDVVQGSQGPFVPQETLLWFNVTVLESITTKTVFGANGLQIGQPHLSYRVMDPLNGGSFGSISLRRAFGALIIY